MSRLVPTEVAEADARAAYERGRADERAAVVAWLRWLGGSLHEVFALVVEGGNHLDLDEASR